MNLRCLPCFRLAALPSAALAVLIGAWGAPSKAKRVSYSADVVPILKAHCYQCHGPSGASGGLRLDSPGAILKGGNSGPLFVAGKSGESLLMRRLKGVGGPQMPMGFKPLSQGQIQLIAKWIDEGGKTVGGNAKHWAYVAPIKPAVPKVSRRSWVKNPIDAFVLAELDRRKLKPSAPASKRTLLRRVYLDLTGVPPTLAQQQAFLNDRREDAYEKLVDQLLASPAYGERMATPWLDLARYADTNGYEKDERRTIWPYRDWVIKAFNSDMPYDQFIVAQVAGDLIPNATVDDRIATGFCRNTMLNEEGGVDKGEQRWLTLVDRVGVTGSVFLGTTLACTQCHDHKYDPFSQEEFYRMLAFYESSDEPTLKLYDPRFDAMSQKITDLESQLPKLQGDKTTLAAVKAEIDTLRQQVAEAQQDQTLVLQEKDEPAEALFRFKGGYLSPGKMLMAGTPKALPPMTPNEPRNRLGLAQWLSSKENPLTARVEVNRLWSMVWGIGLVKTEGDFGTQGETPIERPLLDWLACEFMDQGWRMKSILRLIVTSNTYRQSSVPTARLTEDDPENRLLARGPRFRMSAEMIRDNALEAAGILSNKIGGPSVFPDQPDGVWNIPYNDDKWVNSSGVDRYRRGLYTFWRRSEPYPAFVAFDATSREQCTVNRIRTNTPLQALVLLNDPVYEAAARGLAGKMLSVAPAERLRRGFEVLLMRDPSADEEQRLSEFIAKETKDFEADPARAKELIGGKPIGTASIAESAAYQLAAHAMLNLDEAITME